MHKNMLVQYEGGGYDGCFWEWNFFLFDSEGKFHVIYASGRQGIETEEEALKLLKIKDDSQDSDTGRFQPYVYNLTDENSIDEFQSEVNEGQVIVVTNKVNRIYESAGKDFPMWWKCDICEEKVSEGFAEGFEGCGGIAVQATQKVCADCYCSHSCPYCGEFYEDISDFNDEGYCEFCAEEKCATP